jgi:hypothetical protein
MLIGVAVWSAFGIAMVLGGAWLFLAAESRVIVETTNPNVSVMTLRVRSSTLDQPERLLQILDPLRSYRKRRRGGLALTAAGMAVWVTCLIAFSAPFLWPTINLFRTDNGRWVFGFGLPKWAVPLLFALYYPPIVYLWKYAGSLLSQAARLRAPSATSVLTRDRRRPVLLLRSFDDDELPVTVTPGIGYPLENDANTEPGDPSPETTFERMIRRMFGPIGPVIAIGRPGEDLPPLGAARVWISHSHWKVAVDELIQESQFVVMILGKVRGEDGLAWEVRRLFALDDPSKVVLIVPPVLEPEVQSRWDRYRALSGGRMPEYRGGELAASFGAGWSCRVARDRPSAYPENMYKISRTEDRYWIFLQFDRARDSR